MLRLINRNFIKGVFRGVRPFSSNDDIIVDEYDSTE